MTPNFFAILERSEEDKYFFDSNCFSSSNICRPVKVVRAFLRFLSLSEECPSLSTKFPVNSGCCNKAVSVGEGVDDAIPDVTNIDGCEDRALVWLFRLDNDLVGVDFLLRFFVLWSANENKDN